MIQTAEGGLNETHAILQRMRELAIQGANDTLTDTDRGAIASELTLAQERGRPHRLHHGVQHQEAAQRQHGHCPTATPGADLILGEVLSASGIAVGVNVAGAAAGTSYTMRRRGLGSR